MNQKLASSILALSVCCSLSFGALEFGYVPSKTQVMPNETFTVEIVNLKNGLTNFSVGGVTISDHVGDVSLVGLSAGINPLLPADKRDGTSDIWITNISGYLLGAMLDSGEVLYTFTVTVDAAASYGDVLVFGYYHGANPFGAGNLYTTWNGDEATFEPMTVTVVPEPMTLVLLSIGGLCLRRRS